MTSVVQPRQGRFSRYTTRRVGQFRHSFSFNAEKILKTMDRVGDVWMNEYIVPVRTVNTGKTHKLALACHPSQICRAPACYLIFDSESSPG